MRKRIEKKLKDLVSSASPNGRTKMGEKERLLRRFNNGNIDELSLKRLAFFMVAGKQRKQPKEVVIEVFGKQVTLSLDEYKAKGKEFKVILEVY